ncbi:hypothetical protein NPS53_08095 [Pseudomonas putida]|uniref:hypothetical protein n=1 Tax=Pseudomonas putida TaxID=303 RepID=UPI0023641219|nr:hypothetical protein [Pseudomonas putida]MDD2139531.1 hypothetical protein [Pseudomonas putida]HDS1721454.1 hypothetical protein [Pseudomonas putida]
MLHTYRLYWKHEKPYTIRAYRTDAEALLSERLEYLRTLLTPVSERLAAKLYRLLTGTELADPAYAAQWSAIARKRYCGVLLSALYYVAAEQDLDMTAVLAHRLLQGWTGRSISNRVLIRAFGHPDRTAATKSEDWIRVPALIEKYGAFARKALVREKLRVRVMKDSAWMTVRRTS